MFWSVPFWFLSVPSLGSGPIALLHSIPWRHASQGASPAQQGLPNPQVRREIHFVNHYINQIIIFYHFLILLHQKSHVYQRLQCITAHPTSCETVRHWNHWKSSPPGALRQNNSSIIAGSKCRYTSNTHRRLQSLCQSMIDRQSLPSGRDLKLL